MKFEWPKYRQTIEWETSPDEVTMILNIYKELGNTISFVGGPFDGWGLPSKRELPQMFAIDFGGLRLWYNRIDCDYWTAYEFVNAWELP